MFGTSADQAQHQVKKLRADMFPKSIFFFIFFQFRCRSSPYDPQNQLIM